MGRSMFQSLLFDGLIDSFRVMPDKVAIIAEGRAYTYAEIFDQVIRLSNGLIQLGFKRGDRCVIYMDNTISCVISIYATLIAGGVFVIVNPQTKREKLKFILNDCSAVTLISDEHLYNNFEFIQDHAKSLKSILVSGDLSSFDDESLLPLQGVIDSATDTVNLPDTILNDLAALIYTSGSTGDPKGVMHTHSSMGFALSSLIKYLRLSQEERILLVLPLAFDYGLYQLLMSVQLSATLILERSFTYPAQIFSRMIETSVTVFPAVPTIFSMLLSMNKRKPISFPSVTRVTNTAAALPAEYIKELKQIFPSALIFKMYGLTECKRVSYLEPEKIDKKPGSVGQAIPGTEVFILDKDGKQVKPGETGTLYVRGQHIMRGYWNQAELTRKALVDAELPNEKLLCTHDLFKMDKDGDLYFIGRSDDVIKTRGEKVSPKEVENVVYGINGVSEVAVIGVADNVLGEAVKCFVVLEEDATITLRDVKKECISQLENFMVPKFIEFLPELPKTNTGKINKKGLV
jgi:acyl-CoA synthetase (AMP-forming)/AMP-acid ligase II